MEICRIVIKSTLAINCSIPAQAGIIWRVNFLSCMCLHYEAIQMLYVL